MQDPCRASTLSIDVIIIQLIYTGIGIACKDGLLTKREVKILAKLLYSSFLSVQHCIHLS